MSMTEEKFRMWVNALRSGVYAQARFHLYDQLEPGYCCLGVYCVINGVDLSNEKLALRCGVSDVGPDFGEPELNVLLDIPQGMRETLAIKNDSGVSFSRIAAYLELHRDELVA